MEHVESIDIAKLKVSKTVSLVDIVTEIHQALNENRPEFRSIPQDRQLVAQELLLFENTGTDDLEDFVDSPFRLARATVKLPWVDAIEYDGFLATIQDGAEQIFEGRVDVTATGLMSIVGRTMSAVIYTMASSYAIAFVVITPLMILLVGDLRLGLVSMIPNLTPIIIALGLMGWMDIPCDAFTLLIGSIAIGLAVDDTIHFMHNFRRYFEKSGNVDQAVSETLATTGQAMFYTSLVLSSGFFLYTWSDLINLFNFGFLTGVTIINAFLADVVLAPALMALFATRRSGATIRQTQPMEA